MNFFKRFSKERTDFYKLLDDQCNKTIEGVKLLHEYCLTGNNSLMEKMNKIEHDGDLQRRVLIDEINNTFITPIEREDIFELSKTIDDILDYATSTLEEIEIYNIVPNDDIKCMVEILVKLTSSLAIAINNLKDHKRISTEEAVKAKKLENSMEQVYRKALGKIFESDDIKYILKNRELYRHLSNAADKGDVAADILCHIIVKNT